MITIRPYTIKDKNQINSVAINAFQQFKEQYNDWESLLNSVGNMSSLVAKSLLNSVGNGKVVRAWLVTNDNTSALGFYKKMGF
jgi:hypothetical protein